VFIVTSPLHVLFSIAIARTLGLAGDSYELHWFGKKPLRELSFAPLAIRDEEVRDFAELDLNVFAGFVANAGAYLEATRDLGRPRLLFTCYDTAYPFVALRHDRGVRWNDVGIIEDGAAGYFPHAMPRRWKHPLRSLRVRLARGHGLPFSWNNLGGNPRVGYVSTLSPRHVHVHRRSRAQVLDIAAATRQLIDERGAPPPLALREAGVVLFLPAVLNYRRLDAAGLRAYVEGVREHPQVRGVGSLVVKLHPRERIDEAREALAGVAEIVADDLPIELHMHELDNAIWAGSPTTAMLNKHFLYESGATRFLLLPIPGNPLLERQIVTFGRILGDRVSVG
jgi:hypothetical protein